MKGSVSFLPVQHDPFADLPKGELGARQGPMSWTDWLPFVKEAVKLYGKEKLGEVLGAVTAPGEAIAGRLDPMTPEGLRRVQTLAGLAMAGPPVPKSAIASGFHLPESYIHPQNTPFTSHPALSGMNEPEIRAAGELLEMMKQYGYQTPQEAAKVVSEMAESSEVPHFESAAKKLEEWSGPHGFKFQEEPKELSEEFMMANELGPWAPKEPEPLPKSNPFAYNQRPATPIEEAFYPVNWADLHSTIARPGQTATGQYAENLRRAESLGFNTNFPLFHGAAQTKVKAPEAPAEGLWGPKAEEFHSFLDPAHEKDFERGIFTSDAPEVASLYSGGSDAPQLQGQTFPLFANPKTTLAVDWPSIAGQPSYDPSLMHRVIEAAHEKGADALIVQGMGDVGGLQNQYIFLKPNVLRSPFARFDPKFAESANLTRSGGLGLPLLVPVDHDPFAEPQL